MEKIGNYIVGGKVKWYNYFGKVWQFLKLIQICHVGQQIHFQEK